MGAYERFTPTIIRDQLSSTEIELIETLVALSVQEGDLLYYDEEWKVLHRGTDDEVLTLVAGLPSWETNDAASGTVTSVSIVSANGVSGSVADATTTPAITLVLGNITPSSVTSSGVVRPSADDGAALGASGQAFSDLFLASGAVIDFNAGNVTLTHSAGVLTLAGTLALGANSITMTGSLGTTGARLTKGWFTDLEVTNAIAGSITGNAATVTTNANLTGPVTSTGNATAIADKALAIAKLADGTDGELITWDSSGVIATVAVGTSGQVLTSNGAGAAPTFQGAAVPTTITVADEATDTTCFPIFVTAATGDLGPKTNTGLTFNSNTGLLTATGFSGPLTGNVTGNVSGTAATVTGAAQAAITSLGTLTELQVDIININGNTISTTGGTDLYINPIAGQQLILDSTIIIDAGVVIGATSITSTVFVGALTGNADTATTAATVTDAAQAAITSLGTLTALALVSGVVITFDAGDVTITHSANLLTLAGGGLALTGLLGIDYNPGSDADTDIITIGVTGAPRVFWDESQDKFSSTLGWEFAAAISPTSNDGAALGTSSLAWSDIYLATGGNILVANANAKRTLVLSAAGGSPTTTIGCGGPTKVEAGTNDIDYWALEFDTTTQERAFWNVQMPDNWDGSTLTAIFVWTNAGGATTETVRWGIKARAYADSDAIDQAYGSEVTVDDTWLAQNDVHISAASGAITVGGSPAGGQWVVFNVGRIVASDNMAGDARLLMVKIEYGINAYSD